jgi:levoglucosan dehydrogenase
VKPIGIALIGYGSIGRVHAMAYRDLPFHYRLPAEAARVVGVATGRAETAERAALEIGCPIWTDDYRTLLAREDVQAVDICVPNSMHEEVVLAAAAAGKHVYVEKPLATTVAGAQRMAEAVERAGVKGQLTFNYRFVPAVTRARQLMDAGFVGRIFSFYGCYRRSSYISPEKPLSWKFRHETAGGGALFDLGSHVLDLVAYLLGDVASVQATLETIIPQRPVAPGSDRLGPVEVDDFDLVNLRQADGALGVLEFSRMATGSTNDLRLEIFGSSGALRISMEDPDWLYVYDVREPDQPLGGVRGLKRLETLQRFEGQVTPDWTQPMGFVRAHAECQYQFLRSIWEGLVARPSLRDGVYIQRIMAAAQRSDAESRWVSISEV